jgi:hypothetical protein
MGALRQDGLADETVGRSITLTLTLRSGLKPQMGALFQYGLADGTVGRNITLTLTLTWFESARVETGSNTSTVTLRVAGGDEKENSAWGYNWATLFLGDNNMGT